MNGTFIRGAVLAALTISVAAKADETDEHHVLDEIIVSATPLSRTVEKLAQPTDVVAGDELARQQSESIGETIANQPGVTASYFGPVASRPIIRGQFGERVRVLSNSLDALDASALSEDHAVSIDSILADRIEVIRGPATLLYGSGAAGGLVNVVDSRVRSAPLDKPFSGALALGSSSATDKRSGALSLDFGNDNFVGHFDAFRRDTGDVEIPGFAESALLRALEEAEHEEEEHEEHDEHEEEGERGKIENTASETDGMAASVSFIGDRGFVGVTVSQYDSRYGIPGHHHEHEEEHGEEEHEEEEHEEEEEVVTIRLDQQRVDLHGELNFDGFFEGLKFRVADNDYSHVELEGDEIGTVFDTEGLDARLELRHRPRGALEGAFGVQYKSIDFAAIGEEAFVPSSDTQQFSIFVFEELGLSDTWTLQLSARAEHQELKVPALPDYKDIAYGASVGAIWAATDTLTLSGNLAITERHPTPTELYADGPHLAVQRYERGSVVQGNGLLGKELSTNLDVTLRGRYDRTEFSVTAFVNDVNDYIVLLPTNDTEDELQVYDFSRTDAELQGFELEWLVDLIEFSDGHFHARLFSDYVRGKQKNGGNLPRIPPLRFGAGLHFSTDAFDASLNATYHDSQSKVADNELPTGDYTLIDAEVSYRFAEPDVLLFVRGTNLSDEDARRHSSPLKDLAPLPGRSIHAGLRWNF